MQFSGKLRRQELETSSRRSPDRPTRSRSLRTRLIPRGWWRAGLSTMDWRQRGRSAPMIRRCPKRPFTYTAIYLMTIHVATIGLVKINLTPTDVWMCACRALELSSADRHVLSAARWLLARSFSSFCYAAASVFLHFL